MTPQLASSIATILAAVTASAVAILHSLAFYRSKPTTPPQHPGQFGRPGS